MKRFQDVPIPYVAQPAAAGGDSGVSNKGVVDVRTVGVVEHFI